MNDPVFLLFYNYLIIFYINILICYIPKCFSVKYPIKNILVLSYKKNIRNIPIILRGTVYLHF